MEGLYRLSNSGQVSEQLRGAFAKAEAKGILLLAMRAAKWIVEEVERTPHEFGESRDFLAGAGIQMRIAFSAPLFAVSASTTNPTPCSLGKSAGSTGAEVRSGFPLPRPC